MTTATTPPALIDYRSRHLIKVVRDRDEFGVRGLDRNACAVDGLTVYQRADGRWFHDKSQIKQLAAFERGEKIDWTIR